FDTAVDLPSFTPAAVSLVGPDGKAIPVTAVRATPNSGNRQFDITFATQTAAGSYSLRVGPNVRDAKGNRMGGVYVTPFVIKRSPPRATSRPLPVPSRGRAVAFVAVNQDLTIAQVSVRLSINCNSDSSLYIHLQAPDGTDILLVNRRGSGGQDF